MFKDLKTGYPVYIFNKPELTISQAKVLQVSQPYFETPKPQPAFVPSSQSTLRYVDVTVELDGRQSTYAIAENLSLAYANDNKLVLATDKAGIVREVEAMRTQSQDVISSVDRHKEIIEKTSQLLEEWNPEYREKAETEKRLAALESGMGDIKGMIKTLLDKQQPNGML